MGLDRPAFRAVLAPDIESAGSLVLPLSGLRGLPVLSFLLLLISPRAPAVVLSFCSIFWALMVRTMFRSTESILSTLTLLSLFSSSVSSPRGSTYFSASLPPTVSSPPPSPPPALSFWPLLPSLSSLLASFLLLSSSVLIASSLPLSICPLFSFTTPSLLPAATSPGVCSGCV